MNLQDKYGLLFLDGGLTPAAAKTRYQKRRSAFVKTLKTPVIIKGPNVGPGGKEVWPHLRVPIFQEPLLLWLTGINQLETALFLNPNGKPSEREILFVPAKNPSKEFWEGIRFATADKVAEEELKILTGFKQIKDIKNLDVFLTTFFQKVTNKKGFRISLYWHERSVKIKRKLPLFRDSQFAFKNQCATLLKNANFDPLKAILPLAEKTWLPRLILDQADTHCAQKANRITGLAFTALLPKITSMTKEYQVRGTLEGEMLKQSPYGLAFPSIIASGHNAGVLHYEKADSRLKRGDLLLLDFGSRYQSLHADISRTIPLNGRFNPLQKLLYEIVLDTQTYFEKKCKPGVTLTELNQTSWEYLEALLEKRFLSHGGKMKRAYEKAPHGISHALGHLIHDGDPFGEYKDRALVPEQLITNEPGLYGWFQLKLDGKTYTEDLGIRIEDDLLVTNTGNLNLSKSIPKKVIDLEKWLAKKT